MNTPKSYWITVPGSTAPPLGPLDLDGIVAGVSSGSIPTTANACEVGSATWTPVQGMLPPEALKAASAPAGAKKLSGVQRELLGVGIAILLGGLLAGTLLFLARSPTGPSSPHAGSAASPVAPASAPPSSHASTPTPPLAAPELLAGGLVNPHSITVTDGRAFVTVLGNPEPKDEPAGTVVSVAEGGEVTTLASGQRRPMHLMRDEKTLYWATFERKIWRLSMAGGQAQTLYTASSGVVDLVGLDASDLYFSIITHPLAANGGEGIVYAIPKAGGSTRDVVGFNAFFAAAVGSGVFVCRDGLFQFRKLTDDPTADPLVLERKVLHKVDCKDVQADDVRVYWSQNEYRAKTAGIWTHESGKPSSPSVHLVGDLVDQIVLDGDYVYWRTQEYKGPWHIRRIRKSGGTSEPIADDLAEVTEITVAMPYVYWTSEKAGTVSRVLLPGATAPEKPPPKPTLPPPPTPPARQKAKGKIYPFVCPEGSYPVKGRGGCWCMGSPGADAVNVPPPGENCFAPSIDEIPCEWHCK